MELESFCFNIPQNYLGLYFRISGNSNCNLDLDFLQLSLNNPYAFLVSACFFPYFLFFYLYVYFAYLHDSSNHGARCFDHLFGFFYYLFVLLLITPAIFASSIRNSSTLLVRMSLSYSYYYTTVLNLAAKVVDEVCAFQIFALSMY
jgi:hypothetical protein